MKSLKNTLVFNTAYLAVLFIILAACPENIFAQAEKSLIREGNRLYHKDQFDESELSYRRALEKNEESLQARFNLGNSLYKQERFDEAVSYFGELAEEIDDPLNRSRVYHNLGNSMIMSQQIEQSIEAYKEALRNNPDDPETRYNLAFAQDLLDQMEDRQQDGDAGHEGDDQDQERDDRDQADDDQDTGDQHDQEGVDRDDPQRHDQDQPEDRQSPGQDQIPQPHPDQISPEDALRMLEAAEREDQRVQQKLKEQKASEKQTETGRNW